MAKWFAFGAGVLAMAMTASAAPLTPSSVGGGWSGETKPSSPAGASGYTFVPFAGSYLSPVPNGVGQPSSIWTFTNDNFVVEAAVSGVTYNLGFSYSPNGTTNGLGSNLLFAHDAETDYFSPLGFSADGGMTFRNTSRSQENPPHTAQLYGVTTTAGLTAAAVAEPTTLLLLGTGLIGLATRWRSRVRRRQQKKL